VSGRQSGAKVSGAPVRRRRSAELALAHGNGGVLSSQATVTLGTEATL